MAIGTITVWLQGDIDLLDAMEKVNTTSGREVNHVEPVWFRSDRENRETMAIYETDCSFAFNCYRCQKLVCVGCSEDNPVLVADEDMVRATCGPCFYDIMRRAKTNAET